MIPTSRQKTTKQVGVTVKGLEDQLLRYEKNGERVVTVIDYYNRYIAPFSPSYSRGYSGIGSKVVCPFHEDLAPSMGVLEDSKNKVQIFHCFGCGTKGTVITLHERFCKEHKGMELKSHVDYVKSLANMYGVELKDVQTYEEVHKEVGTDFGATVGYNLRMHQRNVAKVRMMRDTMTLDKLKYYWDEISKRVVVNNTKKK